MRVKYFFKLLDPLDNREKLLKLFVLGSKGLFINYETQRGEGIGLGVMPEQRSRHCGGECEFQIKLKLPLIYL